MNSATLPESGSWTHSFEEDAGDVRTYRPSQGWAFPPARRPRATLAFGPGGAVEIGTPGPDDRLRRTSATVTALGMQRFRLDSGGASLGQIELVAATPDRLKLRWLSQA